MISSSGALTVTVTYVLTNDDAVKIHYRATTDAPTVVNLTQHSYFNWPARAAGRSTITFSASLPSTLHGWWTPSSSSKGATPT